MVYRIYVEKKPGFDVEATGLKNELTSLLGIQSLTGLRLLNRYDVEGIDEELFNQCANTVFSEPPVDNTYAELPASDGVSFAVEYLPGQFDQRVKVLNEEAERSGEACAKALRKSSPKGGSKRKPYRNGWTCKLVDRRGTGSLIKTAVVHNKNKPQIAHLLEYGHAKRNGGMVDGIEHIRPAESEYTEEFVESVKRRLENGT